MSKTNKTMYLAIVTHGQYEDYREYKIFVSSDKKKVLKWVNRLNNLIDIQRDRINRFDFSDGKQAPFHYFEVKYMNPVAEIREIEVR